MTRQGVKTAVETVASTGVAAKSIGKSAPARRKPGRLPPYKILLHNDDVNTFEHVIRAILRLTTLSLHDAVLRTIEAHEMGVALLLTTHRELAELYVEQFASLSLSVTAEAA